jgi:hypothetical protein
MVPLSTTRRQRYSESQKLEALQLLETDFKGKPGKLREYLRKKWRLTKSLPKQTLHDWTREKPQLEAHVASVNREAMPTTRERFPEFKAKLLPTLMELQQAGKLTLDSIRDEARKVWSMIEVPQSNGPQLTRKWARILANRWGLDLTHPSQQQSLLRDAEAVDNNSGKDGGDKQQIEPPANKVEEAVRLLSSHFAQVEHGVYDDKDIRTFLRLTAKFNCNRDRVIPENTNRPNEGMQREQVAQ